MFRLVVGVLAAFVGFSFGHSIPKWMENHKTKSATASQSPSCAHPVRKLLLRRKTLRKFKFGPHKPGKESLEADESLQQLSKDIAEDSHGLRDLSLHISTPNSSFCSGSRVCAEHRKLKFGPKKQLKQNLNNVSSLKDVDSNPGLLLSAVSEENGSRLRQNVSANSENGRCPLHPAPADNGGGHRSLRTVCEKSKIGLQDRHPDDGLPEKWKLEEPVIAKISSSTPQKMCELESPTKQKSQMKQWKMKLMSLRSKAMASEKVWYEKFEQNEKQVGNVPVSSSLKGSVKRQKGKENESSQWASTRRRDMLWSRSSTSKVGLLVEGPVSAFER